MHLTWARGPPSAVVLTHYRTPPAPLASSRSSYAGAGLFHPHRGSRAKNRKNVCFHTTGKFMMAGRGSTTRGSMARCRRVPHWRRTQYGTAARARGRGPAPLRDPRPLAHVSPHNEAAARLSPSCARASDPRMRATSTTSPIRASGPYGGSAGGAHGPHRPQPTPRWTRHAISRRTHAYPHITPSAPHIFLALPVRPP